MHLRSAILGRIPDFIQTLPRAGTRESFNLVAVPKSPLPRTPDPRVLELISLSKASRGLNANNMSWPSGTIFGFELSTKRLAPKMICDNNMNDPTPCEHLLERNVPLHLGHLQDFHGPATDIIQGISQP
jgi:hypothetical protein